MVWKNKFMEEKEECKISTANEDHVHEYFKWMMIDIK